MDEVQVEIQGTMMAYFLTDKNFLLCFNDPNLIEKLSERGIFLLHH